jgi:hypothetical protein
LYNRDEDDEDRTLSAIEEVTEYDHKTFKAVNYSEDISLDASLQKSIQSNQKKIRHHKGTIMQAGSND